MGSATLPHISGGTCIGALVEACRTMLNSIMSIRQTFDFDPLRLALTPTEAAAALGVSKAHVYRMIRRGELHAVRLGRRLSVPTVGLMRLLDVPRPSPGVGGEQAVEPVASPSP